MTDAPIPTNTRCGFVALLGAPNAGKSTLMNALVGAKLSIVSPKVQTTRTRVTGIIIEDGSQLIFVDTPGIFEPRRRLDRAMVRAAWDGAADADQVVLLVDASHRSLDADSERIITALKEAGRSVILVLNKIDLVKREVLLAKAQALNEMFAFTDTFMISATTGSGVADLRTHLAQRMPEGPWHYPEDEMTDMPLRLLAAEITREKLFVSLYQEVPYSLTVETESWEEFDNGAVKISQTIFIQRDSQKAIIIGKGGQAIRKIREEAQIELQEMLERQVHLFLFVKVREGWIDDPDRFKPWGLQWDA
ncbi:MAG: GTPase Era [Alphaproteobacteria bacterium]|nr:GTPase Era [Alphaproteobacteria bacterium]MBU0795970.1 GTPase Era [Alphaproteobacteria bacterium]MBU0885658.1 GTPase Era [Alphaproteobacteria bacterium]MBU1812686.1 GTPase Era [Alphaproteobacteria bacterium]MBU2089206.1 GTPase Era [Alphaproteobacteria bacterium]